MAVRTHIERQLRLRRGLVQRLPNSQITGFHADHRFGLILRNRSQPTGSQRCIALHLKLAIFDTNALVSQLASEVTHRRQKKRGAGFVRPDVGRFSACFHHEHGIGRHVKAVKRSRFVIKLIAQHNNQPTAVELRF